MHKAPYFQILNEEQADIINNGRYSVRYKPGETVLKQGTAANHILSLIDGTLKLYIEGIGEKNLLLGLQKPWALLGGPGIHTDRKIHYSVVALTNVSVCFINIDRFNEVLHLNCDFSTQLIHHISNQAITMFDKLISLTQKQMHGRMADGLLYLSQDFYGADTFDLHLSRQDIADLTAMSKDSAIRILKDFERDGIIDSSGSRMKILDIGQLKEISIRG
jgi:CRP/FNR family transcriptional regulator